MPGTPALILAIVLVLFGPLQGCRYYYKVQTVNKVTPQEVKSFETQNKYIILHHKDKAWHFSSPLLTDSTLYGKLTSLPENRYKFMTTSPTGGNRYLKNKKYQEYLVLEEVHLYVTDSAVPEKFVSGYIRIALSAIKNAEVYMKDKERTTASWVVPLVGGTLLAGGAAIIVASSVNSMWDNMGSAIKMK